MDCQTAVEREMKSSLAVLNYAICEDLPETAKEIGRWMASIVFEFNRELRDEPAKMSAYMAKPYILENYQKQTGA